MKHKLNLKTKNLRLKVEFAQVDHSILHPSLELPWFLQGHFYSYQSCRKEERKQHEATHHKA